MEMPGRPPATTGLVTKPGTMAAAGGCKPNGCCLASEVACDHEKRNSLIVDEDIIRVHPPTSAFVLFVWLPNADVPVPSRMPPNAPGICRVRFERMYRTKRLSAEFGLKSKRPSPRSELSRRLAVRKK